ncbi:Regulator of rDNA transcription protein 15 [Quillaja saponaria]|uniref:Regulator of rDNA transcription protein 15 n=1 Tax=Quillaja saponaria TaxID=32244 RepID=A0AAD7P3M9_QUISA|nr:Regulator of rDNA transcription protein 15 [Quillaja saponaria]
MQRACCQGAASAHDMLLACCQHGASRPWTCCHGAVIVLPVPNDMLPRVLPACCHGAASAHDMLPCAHDRCQGAVSAHDMRQWVLSRCCQGAASADDMRQGAVKLLPVPMTRCQGAVSAHEVLSRCCQGAVKVLLVPMTCCQGAVKLLLVPDMLPACCWCPRHAAMVLTVPMTLPMTCCQGAASAHDMQPACCHDAASAHDMQPACCHGACHCPLTCCQGAARVLPVPHDMLPACCHGAASSRDIQPACCQGAASAHDMLPLPLSCCQGAVRVLPLPMTCCPRVLPLPLTCCQGAVEVLSRCCRGAASAHDMLSRCCQGAASAHDMLPACCWCPRHAARGRGSPGTAAGALDGPRAILNHRVSWRLPPWTLIWASREPGLAGGQCPPLDALDDPPVRWGGAEGVGATMRDTQADVPSARWPRAQLAFKDSMVHGILQFTPSIAFRYVLHRCESRDIRCRESF